MKLLEAEKQEEMVRPKICGKLSGTHKESDESFQITSKYRALAYEIDLLPKFSPLFVFDNNKGPDYLPAAYATIFFFSEIVNKAAFACIHVRRNSGEVPTRQAFAHTNALLLGLN